MTNMIKKLLKTKKIRLMAFLGVLLFACSPFLASAQQYYTYGSNSTPINITTINPENVTSSSVVLKGQVNGSNLYSTYNLETWFQYGISTNLEYSTVHINSNSGYASFNSTVANLSPNTIYYFRAVGQNTQGLIYGNINSFKTGFAAAVAVPSTSQNNNSFPQTFPPSAPTITTNPATSVSTRSAKLNSLAINSFANPASSITWFEWGATPYLGDVTPAISLGSLSSAKHVNTITGLSPSTTYYFRAIMQNGTSRIDGTTLSFTTGYAAIPNPSPTPSLVAEKANEPEPEPEPAVTNTSTVEPAEDEDQDSSLAASSTLAESDSFLPNNVFEWIILVILVLVLLIMSKYLYLSFSAKPTPHTGSHH